MVISGKSPFLTLSVHARGLQYLVCPCVCVYVCLPLSSACSDEAIDICYNSKAAS